MSSTGSRKESIAMPSIDPREEYIIDQIMPTRAVHTLVGPSNVGKSTWLLQILKDWGAGRPVLGYASYPRPAVYVCADRTKRCFDRTLRRMGYTLDMPFFSLLDCNIPRTMKSIMRESRKLQPKAEVMIVDPITALVPRGKMKDYSELAEWVTVDVCRPCEKDGWTLVTTAHTPKMKIGEDFCDLRQRIIGSAAWAGYIESIFVLERGQYSGFPNPTRTLYGLPHNSPEFKVDYRLDSQGLLVEDTSERDEADYLMDQRVDKLEVGKPYAAEIFYAWTDMGFSLHAIKAYLRSAQERGKLEKIKLGVYRRPYST